MRAHALILLPLLSFGLCGCSADAASHDAPDASASDANGPPGTHDASDAPDATLDAPETSTPIEGGKDGGPSSASWARRFGGPGPDNGFRVALDGKDAVLLTGSIRTSADLGAGPFTVVGGGDAFVAKYTSGGEPVWSKHFGSTDASASTGGFGVRALSSGDVVVSGSFDGSVDFGGGAIASAGGGDAFLVRFGADGAHVWSHGFGGPDVETLRAVAVGPDDVVATAGFYMGSPDFGAGPLPNAGVVGVVVATYDASGEAKWTKGFAGTAAVGAMSIAVAASGDVAVVGHFSGTIDLGGGALASDGFEDDVFVALFSPDGDHVWSRSIGAAGTDDGYAIAVDAAGDVVIAGKFQQNVDFGGGASLTSAGANDAFVAKLAAADGATKWAKRFGAANQDRAWEIAVGAHGDVFASGYFDDVVDFGGGPLGVGGGLDGFLVRLSSDGAYVSATAFHGMSAPPDAGISVSTIAVGAFGVALDSTDRAVVSGAFFESIDFGAGPLASAGLADGFVAKL